MSKKKSYCCTETERLDHVYHSNQGQQQKKSSLIIPQQETYSWTKKLNREDYGVDKYWVLLAVVKEKTL